MSSAYQRGLIAALCLIVVVLVLPNPAAATESAAQRGKIYFFSKDYDKAYDAFNQAFLADPTDLAVSFYLGRTAFLKGDYEMAVMAFDRVLIMKPDSIRVKLELARCHMKLGSYETAKQYFYDVLATKPPKQVRDNIDLLLASIAAAEQQNFFSGMFAAGLSYDDNIRSAPGSFLLTFSGSAGDVTFEIDAPAEKDHFFTTTLLLNHIHKFADTPWAWKTTFTNFNNSYLGRPNRDLDINFYGLSTGPLYQTEKMLVEAHAYLNNLELDYSDYVQPTGLGASATFLLEPKFMLTVAGGVEVKDYAKDSDSVKDATNWNASVSPIFTEGNNRYTLTLAKERENADEDYWSYDRFSCLLRYDHNFPKDLSFFTNANFKHTYYDQAKSGESTIRSDYSREVGAGLNKVLWKTNTGTSLSVQISYTNTVVESNITLYSYRKNVSAVLMSYGF